MGYYRAGFEVIGVDLAYQRRFPFTFVHADALVVLRGLLAGEPLHGHYLEDFDAVHASPPCQAFSNAQRIRDYEHPDFVGPVRALLGETGLPWVIENVPGAPLIDPIMLCGVMFPELRVYRHRLFESNIELSAPAHPKHAVPQTKMGRAPREGEYIHVVGNFSGVQYARRAMDVHWMSRDELKEAIPPAFTEYIGNQIKEVIAPHGTDAPDTPSHGRVQHASAHEA